MEAKELLSRGTEPTGRPGLREARRPLLMVDVDGVISLFGPGLRDAAARRDIDGGFHAIDGVPHFLSAAAGSHLLALSATFELVWATGWEERANDHLPHLLGLPAPLPFVRFERGGRSGRVTAAHWKLEAIDAYAGSRALAWVDDAFNPACDAWARARPAPTLLVRTEPQTGLTTREARRLRGWARGLAAD